MASRSPLQFSEDDLRMLAADRYEHPDPRVQRRMEVLWLISQGETQARAGQLGGVSTATVERYVALYRKGGVAALRTFDWVTPKSELEKHRPALEEEFKARPPHTVAEAAQRIADLTGIRRKETQVRQFLKKSLRLKWRRMGAIPLPPKKTIEEHIQDQAEFHQEKLQPALEEAKAGKRTVLFVDAAHFVQSSFLCCVWCAVRMFVRAASGRRRYNVLGAFNPITRQLIRVTNDTRVSADTMIELLGKIAEQVSGPTTLVLDNARYQRCAAVEAEAARLGITLLFLLSYSPNLNLIERLWKFTKKEALRGKHHADFAAFRGAIDQCLDGINTVHKEDIASLITLKFQTFDKASFLAA